MDKPIIFSQKLVFFLNHNNHRTSAYTEIHLITPTPTITFNINHLEITNLIITEDNQKYSLQDNKKGRNRYNKDCNKDNKDTYNSNKDTSKDSNNTMLNNSSGNNTMLNNSSGNNTLLNDSSGNNTLLNNSSGNNTLLNNSSGNNTPLTNPHINNTLYTLINNKSLTLPINTPLKITIEYEIPINNPAILTHQIDNHIEILGTNTHTSLFPYINTPTSYIITYVIPITPDLTLVSPGVLQGTTVHTTNKASDKTKDENRDKRVLDTSSSNKGVLDTSSSNKGVLDTCGSNKGVLDNSSSNKGVLDNTANNTTPIHTNTTDNTSFNIYTYKIPFTHPTHISFILGTFEIHDISTNIYLYIPLCLINKIKDSLTEITGDILNIHKITETFTQTTIINNNTPLFNSTNNSINNTPLFNNTNNPTNNTPLFNNTNNTINNTPLFNNPTNPTNNTTFSYIPFKKPSLIFPMSFITPFVSHESIYINTSYLPISTSSYNTSNDINNKHIPNTLTLPPIEHLYSLKYKLSKMYSILILQHPYNIQDSFIYKGLQGYIKDNILRIILGNTSYIYNIYKYKEYVISKDIKEYPLYSVKRNNYSSSFFLTKSTLFFHVLENNLSRAFMQRIVNRIIMFNNTWVISGVMVGGVSNRDNVLEGVSN
ncbi:hypothetical protein CWI37_2266p0010, partial [Hamiltosporidium tvaerminnensis]